MNYQDPQFKVGDLVHYNSGTNVDVITEIVGWNNYGWRYATTGGYDIYESDLHRYSCNDVGEYIRRIDREVQKQKLIYEDMKKEAEKKKKLLRRLLMNTPVEKPIKPAENINIEKPIDLEESNELEPDDENPYCESVEENYIKRSGEAYFNTIDKLAIKKYID